jgi:4-amino-4-deoxy-L-arabinose transferase-like glycosyltransferase
VLGVFFGLGALTKGPVAIGLPLVVLATTLAVVRREIEWRGRFATALVCAAALGTAFFAAWYLPAASRTQAIAERGPLYETLVRAIAIQEGHGTALLAAPVYYAAVIAIGFAPWTGQLLRAMRANVRARDRSIPNVLLTVWVLLPFLAFTLAATKLPHYILPVWPALAIAVARVVDSGKPADEARIRRIWRLASVGAAVLLVLALVVGPVVEQSKPVTRIAEIVRTTHVDGPLFAYEFAEPSLVFYTGRPLIEIPNEATLVEWARAPGPALLAVPRAAILRIERFYGPLGLREIAAKRGWNYVKGTRVELVAFVRGSDR